METALPDSARALGWVPPSIAVVQAERDSAATVTNIIAGGFGRSWSQKLPKGSQSCRQVSSLVICGGTEDDEIPYPGSRETDTVGKG